mgnify:CR=1 FL=1
MNNSRKRCVRILQNFMVNGNSDGWGIGEVLDYISMPMTLADILGWEEEAVYKVGELYYSIVGENLYYFKDFGYPRIKIIDLLELVNEAEKVEPKKYYLKHKYLREGALIISTYELTEHIV